MKKPLLVFVLLFISLLGAFFLFKRIRTIEVIGANPNHLISKETMQLISEINNDQVDWSGTFIGVEPISLTGATLLLRDSKENIDSILVTQLMNKQKYVAAHVLLTLRNLWHYSQDSKEWNGLKVQIDAKGQAAFNGNNLFELTWYWINLFDY